MLHPVQAVQSFLEQIASCNIESCFPLTEPRIWGSCGAREQGKKQPQKLISFCKYSNVKRVGDMNSSVDLAVYLNLTFELWAE